MAVRTKHTPVSIVVTNGVRTNHIQPNRSTPSWFTKINRTSCHSCESESVIAYLKTRNESETFYFNRGTVKSTTVVSTGQTMASFFQTIWKILGKGHNFNYYIIQAGNSCETDRQIVKHLHKHVAGLKQVYNVEECDVILAFCPIVSRAGTDMEAALNELHRCSASKPAVFMVLHHTYEREKIVPDSSRFVNRENTLTVNCLFNEDDGLLKCAMNDGALTKIIERFKPQNQFRTDVWKLLLRHKLHVLLGITAVTGILYFFYIYRIGPKDHHED